MEMCVNTVSADHDVFTCSLPTSVLRKWTDNDLQEPEKDNINPVDLLQKHRDFYSSWADSIFFFLSSCRSPNLHLIAGLLLLVLKSRTLGQELKFKNWGIVPPEMLATLLPTVSINNAPPQDLTRCFCFTSILSLTLQLQLSTKGSEMPEVPPPLLQARKAKCSARTLLTLHL